MKLMESEILIRHLEKYLGHVIDMDKPGDRELIERLTGDLLLMMPSATAYCTDAGIPCDTATVFKLLAAFGAAIKEIANENLEPGSTDETTNGTVVSGNVVRKLFN